MYNSKDALIGSNSYKRCGKGQKHKIKEQKHKIQYIAEVVLIGTKT